MVLLNYQKKKRKSYEIIDSNLDINFNKKKILKKINELIK